MARTASVSDLEIFSVVRFLTGQLGGRPSVYAIRKEIVDEEPGRPAPSYGLIKGALQRLDQLLALGHSMEDITGELSIARAERTSDPDDAVDRLVAYLTGILTPVASKLFKDAQAMATHREDQLEIDLDRANSEVESLRTKAKGLSDELSAVRLDLQSERDAFRDVSSNNESLRATVTAQASEIAHLKTLSDRDRDALDRSRESHKEAMQKTHEEYARQRSEQSSLYEKERKANSALQYSNASLIADKSALLERLRFETEQRESAQRICGEQSIAIEAAKNVNFELQASLEAQRAEILKLSSLIEALRSEDSVLRAKFETINAENAMLRENALRMREENIQLTSRTRELEGVTVVLRESIAARDNMISARRTNKKPN